ncbi:MAG: hypothetical protein V1707_00890 [bacterium]
MKPKDWLLAIVEAILWYGFIYYLLYAIKNEVDIAQASLILLVIMYLATISCPWVRNSVAWRRMWGKE